MLRRNKDYFNDDYFEKILRLSSENRLEEAISEFHKYIENYPNDIGGYIYCADTYMKMGNFYEAEKMLQRVNVKDRTSQAAKDRFFLFKIKLLFLQKNYNECYYNLINNIDVFKTAGWNFLGLLLYLRKQLGILNLRDYLKAQENYLLGQIVSYSEENAILHISEHIPLDNKENFLQFVDSFPLQDVYYKVRKMLPLDNKMYSDTISNSYVFKYVANGHVGSKLVDYFMVITLIDTNEIITMYPYENKERRECIDLTPVVKESPKVKRMSQIDKFNQRYSKK